MSLFSLTFILNRKKLNLIPVKFKLIGATELIKISLTTKFWVEESNVNKIFAFGNRVSSIKEIKVASR